jgi:superfamily I DNA/RNA helicase
VNEPIIPGEPQWDEGIEGVAYDIAASDDARLRVLAGPGTGKTFALKRKVMRLLQQEHVHPKRILVVTFTRTAAQDLKNELDRLGVVGCEYVDARTLHSFCFRLLRRNDLLAPLSRKPRAVVGIKRNTKFEMAPLLEDLNNKEVFGDKRKRGRLVREYEAAWAKTMHDTPGWVQSDIDAQFEKAIMSWLVFHEAILIGELVPVAYNYLNNNPASEELHAYDHVIVDEYQDLNKAEQLLIDLLAQNGTLTVIGDEDQSIYSFRFANPDGVDEFAARHANCIDKTLDLCRRCREPVVAIAGSVIKKNHIPPAKPGRAMHSDPTKPIGTVRVVQWGSVKDEIEGTAEYIAQLINSGKYEPKDILVLSARRQLAYELRDKLKLAGVEAHSFYHEEALEDEKAQKAFCLFTLFVHADDRVALRFWLGCESPNYLSPQYAKLRSLCESSGMHPRDALEAMADGRLDAKGFSDLLKRYKALNKELAKLQGADAKALFDALFPESASWAKQFRDVMADFQFDDLTDPEEVHSELLRYITQPDVPTSPDYVRIMSMHKSKGLTSEVVVAIGLVKGLMPYLDTRHTIEQAADSLEEQRRLFYVAITRPRSILILSSWIKAPLGAAKKMGVVLDGKNRAQACTFLSDLGPSAPSAISGAGWRASGFQ